MKKILLACPVSSYKAYVLFDWLAYIKDHFGRQCDILLVDNSKDKQFHRMIAKTGTAVIWRPPRKGEQLTEVMTDCLNIINRKVQRDGYTHWFSVECDVFPPPGTLEVLAGYNLDLIGASYCIDFGEHRKMMCQVSEGFITGNVRNMSQSNSFGLVDGSIHRVLSPGLGCVLIRSSLISNYVFNIDSETAAKVHADTFFYRDLRLKNIPVYVHTGIICKHLNQSWNEINKQYTKRAV